MPGFGLSGTTCGTTCTDGFFLNKINRKCVACEATCKTCNGDKDTHCLTCPLVSGA